MLSLVNPVIALILFAALVPMVALPWIHRQYARHGRLRGWSALLAAAEVLYLCGLVAFTIFPLPQNDAKPCTGDFLTLDPRVDLVATGAAVAQIGLNVVLFLPLGYLLRYRFGRGMLASTAIGLAVSLVIETTQGTADLGLYACPYRVADVGDLIVNTTGALLGWLVAAATVRFLPDPEPAWSPDLDRPGLARRGLAVLADLLIAYLGAAVVSSVVILAGGPHLDVLWSLTAVTGTALLAPLLRRDRATLGQVTFFVAPTAADATRAVLVRFAVWWLPVAFLQATGHNEAILGAMVVGGVLAHRRPDRRSVLELLAGTTVLTRRALEAGGSAR